VASRAVAGALSGAGKLVFIFIAGSLEIVGLLARLSKRLLIRRRQAEVLRRLLLVRCFRGLVVGSEQPAQRFAGRSLAGVGDIDIAGRDDRARFRFSRVSHGTPGQAPPLERDAGSDQGATHRGQLVDVEGREQLDPSGLGASRFLGDQRQVAVATAREAVVHPAAAGAVAHLGGWDLLRSGREAMTLHLPVVRLPELLDAEQAAFGSLTQALRDQDPNRCGQRRIRILQAEAVQLGVRVRQAHGVEPAEGDLDRADIGALQDRHEAVRVVVLAVLSRQRVADQEHPTIGADGEALTVLSSANRAEHASLRGATLRLLWWRHFVTAGAATACRPCPTPPRGAGITFGLTVGITGPEEPIAAIPRDVAGSPARRSARMA